ncbi:MAG: N-acetylmuramoyl-L-alanine amidase [Capsulimonadaceae bacterium]|nr:N-acetylmuramoyl-L-alanine amidase [Capsulimonadaceae bacterium]
MTIVSSFTPIAGTRFRTLIHALVLAFCGACLASGAAFASPRVAHLIVGGHEALFMVNPYVDDDDVVYGPSDWVHLLGAEFKQMDDRHLAITSAEGRVTTIPFVYVSDRLMIPVQRVAEQLGADVSWNRRSRTMTLRAKILVVRVESGRLTVATSYPVDSQTGTLSNPSRMYIDLAGAMLPSGASNLPVRSEQVTRVRSKQIEFNTARIALDLNGASKIPARRGTSESLIQISLGSGGSPALVASEPVSAPAPLVIPVAPNGRQADPAVTSVASPDANGQDVRIVGVEFQAPTDSRPTVVITTTGRAGGEPRVTKLDDPARFAVDLPGATLAINGQDAASSISVTNPIVKMVRWGTLRAKNGSAARVVLDLAKSADFRVSAVPASDGSGTRYVIALPDSAAPLSPAPPVADNNTPTAPNTAPSPPVAPTNTPRPAAIDALTIVIDPGHGGHDGGAPGGGSLWEKNLTLQIARRVRTLFEHAGAKVIMTRNDDTFIPLPDRSQMGIDGHADLFVSIHCDSGNARNANTGSTVYYHANNAVCKELAADIAGRLKEANCGIVSNGIRTDYVRFPGIGFSVLRRSPEPAVLVECGYINSDTDASALQQEQTQDLIAQSILAGVKDYVANRVATN